MRWQLVPGATVGVGETNDEGPGLPLGALSLLWQRDMLVTLLTPQETQISSVLWEHWWALAGEGSRRRQRRRANSKELAKGTPGRGSEWGRTRRPEGLEQRAEPRRDSGGRQGPGHEEPACPHAKQRGDGGSRDKAGGRRQGLRLRDEVGIRGGQKRRQVEKFPWVEGLGHR